MVTSQGPLIRWIADVWAALFRESVNRPGPLECDYQLPLVVEDITREWLSRALNVKVESLELQEVIHGSGSKVLVEVTYTKSSKHGLPTRLCIKGGFNPQILELLPTLFAVYRLEANFYHHIAPQISALRLIPSFWCGVDRPSAKGQGIVVLQDVKAAGWTFGDPRQTWPVARVRAALSQLARLHAATWGARQADLLPWVPRASALRAVIADMMTPESWARRFDDPAVRPPIPAAFWADRARVVRCLEALWAAAADGARMTCVVHGDTQVGNTFVDAEGQPGFLDWQGVHVSSAAHDVTYFMTGALEIEDRRQHERALYGFYLDELSSAGGPRLDIEDVWDVS